MHSTTRRHPFLVLATRVLLLIALAAVTVAVAQVHVAGDRSTTLRGIPVAGRGNCVSRCNESFIRQLQDENKHHKKVVQDECGANFVCHKDENYRHQVALRTIMAGHKACTSDCAPQGSGTTGS